jgi:VanZ family protein
MLIPADQLSKAKIMSYDKLGHALLFGSWTLLYLQLRFPTSVGNINVASYWKSGLLGTVFGGAMELLQLSLPIMRSASWADWVADIIGVVLFLGIHYLIFRPEK